MVTQVIHWMVNMKKTDLMPATSASFHIPTHVYGKLGTTSNIFDHFLH